MPKIQLLDETIAGQKGTALELEWGANTISARDLIASRVEEEVRRHNARNSEIFHGLVQPTDSERVLNGFRLRSPRPIDATAQIELALRAFESNGFFLLVNDRQIESLDELIAIELETQVSFVKLVPLKGG
ncbi:hypothetical protein EON83_22330 [bacterium]|nr:MAG: hypothetical protein EON83_22330 [bacterium]